MRKEPKGTYRQSGAHTYIIAEGPEDDRLWAFEASVIRRPGYTTDFSPMYAAGQEGLTALINEGYSQLHVYIVHHNGYREHRWTWRRRPHYTHDERA